MKIGGCWLVVSLMSFSLTVGAKKWHLLLVIRYLFSCMIYGGVIAVVSDLLLPREAGFIKRVVF